MNLPKTYQAKIRENTNLTSSVRKLTIDLIKPSNIAFLAGQFVMLEVAEGLKKPYSIASPPQPDGYIELIVDTTPGGIASKYFINTGVGSRCVFTGPYGTFNLRNNSNNKIFIVTSSGIAPFRSMIRDFFAQNSGKPSAVLPKLSLYFGAHAKEDILLADEFRGLEKQYANFKYIPVVKYPDSTWQGETGFVTDPLIRDLTNLNNKDFYLCGSPRMVIEAKKRLLERGVKTENIYSENY